MALQAPAGGHAVPPPFWAWHERVDYCTWHAVLLGAPPCSLWARPQGSLLSRAGCARSLPTAVLCAGLTRRAAQPAVSACPLRPAPSRVPTTANPNLETVQGNFLGVWRRACRHGQCGKAEPGAVWVMRRTGRVQGHSTAMALHSCSKCARAGSTCPPSCRWHAFWQGRRSVQATRRALPRDPGACCVPACLLRRASCCCGGGGGGAPALLLRCCNRHSVWHVSLRASCLKAFATPSAKSKQM